jgi:hypothetical protein
MLLNPDPLHFVKAHVIVAPVIQARRLRVRVPGHALLASVLAATAVVLLAAVVRSSNLAWNVPSPVPKGCHYDWQASASTVPPPFITPLLLFH